MRIFKQSWIRICVGVFVCALISFVAWRTLLSPGYFSMHDDQQVVRLSEYDKALTSGQFPVRYSKDLGYGYGYPVFNFYPQLPYAMGEALHLIFGLGFMDSIKAVWLLAILGSGIAMYFFAREFFGELGGLVSAAFYVYAPYHAVDAFVRGALAELVSFVWLPLIFLASYKKRPLLAGVLLGFLMISHNLIFLPFVGFFLLWNLFLGKKQFISSFISVIVCFGLTAFFWLPSLYEKQFTLVDQLLIKNLASYKIHFLCFSQLFYSPWGFGGSTAGCFDGMSFMVGKTHFLALGLGILAFFWRKIPKVLLFFVSLFTFSVFMTLPISQFLWDRVSVLWYLQFPWRFLEFVVFSTSLLAGSAVLVVGRSRLLSLVASIALIIGVIWVNGKYFVPQTKYLDAADQTLLSDYKVKWYVSDSSFEYLPAGFASKIGPKGTLVADVSENQVASSSYSLFRGKMDSKFEAFRSGKFSLIGDFSDKAIVRFSTTNFPGWKIWIDGQTVGIDDSNPYKLLTIGVPDGAHEIIGEFTNTPVRSIGNGVSVFCILSLVSWFLLRLWKKKRLKAKR